MSALEVLLAVAGLCVTAMVVAAMILLTPSGGVEVHSVGTDPNGSNLSPTAATPPPVAHDESAQAPALS